VNVTVLPYASPTIDGALFFARRSDVGGTLDEEGTYLRVDLKASVSSLINSTERNRLRYKIYTRERGTDPWTTVADTTLSAITYNSFVAIAGYAIETSYDVLVEVLDDVSGLVSIGRTLATAAVFMHWGDGLGIGKFWEDGALDVLGDGYFSGELYSGGERVINVTDLATETVAGVVERATTSETTTGTDTTRYVSPAGRRRSHGDGQPPRARRARDGCRDPGGHRHDASSHAREHRLARRHPVRDRRGLLDEHHGRRR